MSRIHADPERTGGGMSRSPHPLGARSDGSHSRDPPSAFTFKLGPGPKGSRNRIPPGFHRLIGRSSRSTRIRKGAGRLPRLGSFGDVKPTRRPMDDGTEGRRIRVESSRTETLEPSMDSDEVPPRHALIPLPKRKTPDPGGDGALMNWESGSARASSGPIVPNHLRPRREPDFRSREASAAPA